MKNAQAVEDTEKNLIRFEAFGLQFEIDKKRWLFYSLISLLGLSILLLVSTVFFEYEMTNADLPGGFVFGILLGCFLHLLLD